jgi:hypothetical protein
LRPASIYYSDLEVFLSPTPAGIFPMWPIQFDPLIASGVATATTDAVYLMFIDAVMKRRRLPAATWSATLYLLSSFAVISYTNNWVYVLFAAAGSWIGAFGSMTFLHPVPTYPTQPPGSAQG